MASCDTGRDGSATGDKVQNVPASGGKYKVIQAFGCRIRCAIDKEAEMRTYIADERSKRTEWTDGEWRLKLKAIAAERRWGVGQHGGKRKGDADAKPAAGGDDSAYGVWTMQPDGKREGDAENAKQYLPPTLFITA